MPRYAKPAVITAVGLSLFVVAYILILKWSDSTTYFNYASYAETRRDAGIISASLPSFIPKSARDIKGLLNVEFNVHALEFGFDASDLPGMVIGFENESGDAGRSAEKKIRSYRWEIPPSRGPVATYISDLEGKDYLMIDEPRSRAYYVSEPRRR